MPSYMSEVVRPFGSSLKSQNRVTFRSIVYPPKIVVLANRAETLISTPLYHDWLGTPPMAPVVLKSTWLALNTDRFAVLRL